MGWYSSPSQSFQIIKLILQVSIYAARHREVPWEYRLPSENTVQCPGQGLNPNPLIRSPVHKPLHHLAYTSLESKSKNRRKLPICVYCPVHDKANASSLTETTVLGFRQTSTVKCMHHPTKKEFVILSRARHSKKRVIAVKQIIIDWCCLCIIKGFHIYKPAIT